MRRLALVLLLASCGRLSFDQGSSRDARVADDGSGTDDDAGTITPVGHDEDGDGIDDALDPCPHLPAVTADGDGDRVGDACDPEPTVARQQLVRFVTMTPDNLPSEQAGNWVQNADSLSFDGAGYARITVAKAFSDGRVVVGLDIEEQVGTPLQHQIAFGGGIAGSGTSYFGEVKQEMGMQAILQLSLENEMMFSQLTTSQIAASIPLGPSRLTMDYTAAPATAALEAVLGGVPRSASISAPLYAGTDYFAVGSNNVRITLHYLLVIRTN